MDPVTAFLNVVAALIERSNKVLDGASVEQRIEYAKLDLEIQKNWIGLLQPVLDLLIRKQANP